jgi:hypothetical protein
VASVLFHVVKFSIIYSSFVGQTFLSACGVAAHSNEQFAALPHGRQECRPHMSESLMQFQFGVPQPPPNIPPEPDNTAELLRQMLEVQKELLAVHKAMLAAMDGNARWRILLNRWREDFPTLSESARDALPVLERAYASILSSLVDDLRDRGADGIDNEFALQEFLDRYGMRLGQMSHLLNLVSPLAEMAQQNEPS